MTSVTAPKKFSKWKTIQYLSIFTLVSYGLALVCWLLSPQDMKDFLKGMNYSYNYSSGDFFNEGIPNADKTVVIKKSIPLAVGVKNLEVNVDAMDFVLNPSEDGVLQLQVNGDGTFSDKDLDIKMEGDTLRINVSFEERKGININFGEVSKKTVAIFAPNLITSVRVRSGVGDTHIKDVSLDTFKQETGAGDIVLTQTKLKALDIATGTGDLEFKGDLQTLNFKSGAGDAKIQIENPAPRIDFASGTGDLEVKFLKNVDLEMSFEAMTGSYEVNANDGKDIIKGEKNLRAKVGNGTGHLEMKTAAGDLKIY